MSGESSCAARTGDGDSSGPWKHDGWMGWWHRGWWHEGEALPVLSAVLVAAEFAPGDLVIVEGVQSVRPGAPVRVQGEDAAAEVSAGAAPPAKL